MDSDYEWDPAKAAENRLKHGIDFADAVGVLEDPLAITVRDDYPHELRLVPIGRDVLDRTRRRVHVAGRGDPNHFCAAGDTR